MDRRDADERKLRELKEALLVADPGPPSVFERAIDDLRRLVGCDRLAMWGVTAGGHEGHRAFAYASGMAPPAVGLSQRATPGPGAFPGWFAPRVESGEDV